VLLTHRDGVLVRDAQGTSEAPWSGWTLEGRTGRGDTCTAAFLVGLDRGLARADALALAARVTSEKMGYRGPYRG
jgi:sugar/nucleoside kinase (ribokinase family)